MKNDPRIEHGEQVVMLQDVERLTLNERRLRKLDRRCCNFVSHLVGLAVGTNRASPLTRGLPPCAEAPPIQRLTDCALWLRRKRATVRACQQQGQARPYRPLH